MRFPADPSHLIREGYIAKEVATCRSCHRPIRWWQTPSGKAMPMDLPTEAQPLVTSHFATCPNAAQHRRPR